MSASQSSRDAGPDASHGDTGRVSQGPSAVESDALGSAGPTINNDSAEAPSELIRHSENLIRRRSVLAELERTIHRAQSCTTREGAEAQREYDQLQQSRSNLFRSIREARERSPEHLPQSPIVARAEDVPGLTATSSQNAYGLLNQAATARYADGSSNSTASARRLSQIAADYLPPSPRPTDNERSLPPITNSSPNTTTNNGLPVFPAINSDLDAHWHVGLDVFRTRNNSVPIPTTHTGLPTPTMENSHLPQTIDNDHSFSPTNPDIPTNTNSPTPPTNTGLRTPSPENKRPPPSMDNDYGVPVTPPQPPVEPPYITTLPAWEVRRGDILLYGNPTNEGCTVTCVTHDSPSVRYMHRPDLRPLEDMSTDSNNTPVRIQWEVLRGDRRGGERDGDDGNDGVVEYRSLVMEGNERIRVERDPSPQAEWERTWHPDAFGWTEVLPPVWRDEEGETDQEWVARRWIL